MDTILKPTSDQKEENREIREEIDMLKECMLNSKGEELAPTKREFLLIYWLVHSYHVIYLHLCLYAFKWLDMLIVA